MKKIIFTVASLLLIAATSQAAPADKFLGTFKLVKSETKGSFCYEGVKITSEDKMMSLYRTDVSGMGPLYSAQVNGPGRNVRYSHGEAFSSMKGKDTVSFLNNTLTFSFKGRQNVAGIPALRITDSLSLKLNKDGKTLQVERRSTEGPLAGVGKKESASCVYLKQ